MSTGMTSAGPRGAAYWLWEEGQHVERQIDRLTGEIEDLERQIVEARTKRDELRVVAAEMRAAQQLIEQSGLTVERAGTAVNVSFDPAFAARTSAEGA